MAAPAYGSHVNNVVYFWLPLGTRTADTTEATAIDAPFAGKLVLFEVTARASSGTSPTMTVDIQQGTTSLLSEVVSITADERTEATIATASTFTKDTRLSIDFDIGGTDTPTFSDITVLIGIERR